MIFFLPIHVLPVVRAIVAVCCQETTKGTKPRNQKQQRPNSKKPRSGEDNGHKSHHAKSHKVKNPKATQATTKDR
jgi:hypothetical protein